MALNPVVIERGLRIDFAKKMAQFQAARQMNPGILAAAMFIMSTGAYEKMGWLGAMPAVQEWVGTMAASELADYDYTVRNRDWYASVPVNQNDLDDDQTATIQAIPDYLVQRILTHPEKLMMELITGGTSGLAYDGVAFFSNASGARTIDNLLAGSGTTLAQLSTDLNAALVAMAGFTDDKGEILNIKGNLIVCPMALENNFKRLVQSAGDPTVTGGNTFNPYAGRFTVIGDARLDASDVNDWYLFATNEIVKPFVFSMRKTAEPRFFQPDNGLTKQWIASSDYRGNAAYGIPHLAVKTVNS
jgi:phage major head subunit gpT-like protein